MKVPTLKNTCREVIEGITISVFHSHGMTQLTIRRAGAAPHEQKAVMTHFSGARVWNVAFYYDGASLRADETQAAPSRAHAAEIAASFALRG